MRILNGRSIGDSFGSYTCFKERGCSVVDYMLTDEENITNIAYFEVGKFDGSISDHCYISSGLRIGQTNFIKNVNVHAASPFPSRFVWNTNCITAYQSVFKHENIKNLINDINHCEYNMSRDGIDL